MTLLSFTASLAQNNASFSGQILDEHEESVPGITIMIDGTAKGAISDFDGKFKIENIPLRAYTIKVSGISHENHEFQMTFHFGQHIVQSVILKESTSELDEVIVTAQSEDRDLKLSAKSVQVIETREVKLKTSDLGEVIAQTEGVSVQRAGSLGSDTRFSLYGLSGDQIRFFYDGIPLDYTPYSFGIANVPINAIDRIEIYKGLVPIRFGADALGGAVNLTSQEVYDDLVGSASYQVGSFNTHRSTGNINYGNEKTGLFAVLGGFYDITDNNYKIDVAIANEEDQLQQNTVRRFHDGYRAYGVNFQLGIRNRSWAKILSIEGYYGNYKNQVQNSQSPGLVDEPTLGIEKAVAGSPFGEVLFTSFSSGLNLNYNVNLADQLEFDLKAGHNHNERVSIDTSRNLYKWLGEVMQVQSQQGEFGQADHLITKSESAFAHQQLIHKKNDKYLFKLSIAPTYTHRTEDDLLIECEFDQALDDRYLFDLVTGLEYTINLLDKRLQNIAFVKNYRQSIYIEFLDPSLEETLLEERSVSNNGVGNGLKYSWSPKFSTKLSYEFAYRLPRQDEIFGDGQLILENLELLPESSHNINLQWSYTVQSSASDWTLEGNFFLRKIDDLIFLLVDPRGLGSYQNVWSRTSQRFEIGGRWENLAPGFTTTANTTYQHYVNTSDTGSFTRYENDRIPNIPYFFVNGSAEYKLLDLFKKQDELSLFWSTRYVKGFLSDGRAQACHSSKQKYQTKLCMPLSLLII
ncbi:MAG: carboxypeptidase-like regulatory domain-containing protein [Bacteroidota bacterium]